MRGLKKYLSGLFQGVRSLLQGMSVTGYHFFHPREIVTQQYPENRATLEIFERSKGELTMPHNELNEHKCTACGICQMVCPNGTITVLSKTEQNEDGKSKKVLDRYIYRLDQCTFCALCVKNCPSDAITFAPTFENAVYTRALLTKQLNKEGSKLQKKS